MDATTELTRLSGLQQLQGIFAGKTGYAGIVKTLDLHPVSAEEGFVVFEGTPSQAVYNPLGSVHGGYAATLLDTVMGCAVHAADGPTRRRPRTVPHCRSLAYGPRRHQADAWAGRERPDVATRARNRNVAAT